MPRLDPGAFKSKSTAPDTKLLSTEPAGRSTDMSTAAALQVTCRSGTTALGNTLDPFPEMLGGLNVPPLTYGSPP